MEPVCRAMLADPHPAGGMAEAIASTELFRECIICRDGAEAEQGILSLSPRLLVCELVLPRRDGLYLAALASSRSARVIACSAAASDFAVSAALSLGAERFIKKPFDETVLKRRIIELFSEAPPPRARVSLMMQRLGVSAACSGFAYLREAVLLALSEPSVTKNMMHGVYERLAVSFDTKPSRVERNMRHAIERAWTRGDIDYTDGLFGYSIDADKGKPTCAAFIATLADRLRRELSPID